MPDILLTTLTAKYIHAGFGLRYLLSNMGGLRERSVMREFDINQKPLEIAEKILSENPVIVGFGVYIWNVTETQEVVSVLRRIAPEIKIVLGGPEVSYETETHPLLPYADYIIKGEADLAFGILCGKLLAGQGPEEKIIDAGFVDVARLILPYALYTDEDIAHRIVYVEASRGCPFTCEFCLSSLDIPVRQFVLESFLGEMQMLYDRGLQHFKFVDRTFNLHLPTAQRILGFFLERLRPGLFVHFEMVPDRLPEELRMVIAQFPAGVLQFEVGIQSFNPEVAALISRRQNYAKLADNLRWLRGNTGVHIHADLICGLPGETLESFGKGFDELVALDPQEIQIGILKRLRGTPIIRHDQEWEMVYGEQPPYEILRNKLLGFDTMQRMRRFAKYWDMIGNSGNFSRTRKLLWQESPSPFVEFLALSDWLWSKLQRTDSIALMRLIELLFEYLRDRSKLPPAQIAQSLYADYAKPGRNEAPDFLKEFIPTIPRSKSRTKKSGPTVKRQARHMPVSPSNQSV